MILLVGEFPCTIDSKNRLMIPAEFRRALDQSGSGSKLFAVLHKNDVLRLMPQEEFSDLVSRIPQSRLPSDDQIRFKRMFFRRSRELEPDKQGRIVLPEAFIGKAGLGREVSVLGQGGYMELHSRDTLADLDGTDEFNTLYDAMADAVDQADA